MDRRALIPLFAAVAAVATARAQPIISVSPDTLNFGHVSPRQFVGGTITVYNHGLDTLVIRDIETTCGCTSATADETRVAYMETATIRVSLNIEHRIGRFIQSVQLATNDPASPVRIVPCIVEIDSSGATAPH